MLDYLIALDQQATLALNGSDSIMMDTIMLLLTSTIVWIPMGLYFLYHIYRKTDARTLLFVIIGIALCILFADFVSSGICKPLVARLRPSNEPALYGLVDLVNNYHGGRYGFFSSHAANTMSVAVFLSLQLRKPPVVTLLILWSLINCWSRLYLGVHYLGDVLVGIMWGVTVGWGVHLILRKQLREVRHIDTKSLVTAIILTFVVIVALAPVLTAK